MSHLVTKDPMASAAPATESTTAVGERGYDAPMVCFHGHVSCLFCSGPAPLAAPLLARPRCSVCGERGDDSTCKRCKGRGFRPLTLFKERRARRARKEAA